jgi:hypothetical protein
VRQSFRRLASAPDARAAASCGRIDGVFFWDAGDGRWPDDFALGESVLESIWVPEPSAFGDRADDHLTERKPLDVTVAVAI